MSRWQDDADDSAFDLGQTVVKGTCQALEKSYFRYGILSSLLSNGFRIDAAINSTTALRVHDVPASPSQAFRCFVIAVRLLARTCQAFPTRVLDSSRPQAEQGA